MPFSASSPQNRPKNAPRAATRGLRRLGPQSASRQGNCTGSRAKNAQGPEKTERSRSDRAEDGVRASPFPRSNRAPCAKKPVKERTQTAGRKPLRGLPTAAISPPAFQNLRKGKDLWPPGQSLERGISSGRVADLGERHGAAGYLPPTLQHTADCRDVQAVLRRQDPGRKRLRVVPRPHRNGGLRHDGPRVGARIDEMHGCPRHLNSVIERLRLGSETGERRQER